MIGWLGDVLRLWWGLLYWNTRKSWFRLHGDRNRSPCQNASDSGKALETGCDAAQDWHQPARFRRVCPLLVDTPDGLRCAVDTRDVRPFWLRAAAHYAGAAAALYLAAVLGGFALLRTIGYPVSPLTLAWPPRWPQLRIARSQYFAEKARQALAAHRVNEAMLSLEIAFHNNPRNYSLGLELAQLMALGQPAVADRLFGLLMRDHPDQREQTAEAWYRFLLVQGRFEPATALVADRVVQDAARRPAWLHALFFLTGQSHDDQTLQNLVAQHAKALNPIDVALINSELLIRHGQGFKLIPGLTTELPASAGPFAPYYQVSRLTQLGRAGEALNLLDHYAADHRIADADAYRLRLDAMAALGRQDLLRQRLQQAPINARELEMLSLHLVRHPDAGVLDALAACLEKSPQPSDAATYSACTSYFIACGVAQDWTKFQAAAARLAQISGSRLPQLDSIEAFFRQKEPGRRVETILPSLPGLSVDAVYALYEHYGATAPGVGIRLNPAK